MTVPNVVGVVLTAFELHPERAAAAVGWLFWFVLGFVLVWGWRWMRRRADRARPDWLAGAADSLPIGARYLVRLAADEALQHMLAGRPRQATMGMLQLERELGVIDDAAWEALLISAMLRWCDAALDAMGLTARHTAAIAAGRMHIVLGFGTYRGGEVVDSVGVDDVDAASLWAGRLLAARAAGDRDTAIALIDAVPDRDQLVARAAATLQLVVSSVRTGQRLQLPDPARAGRR